MKYTTNKLEEAVFEYTVTFDQQEWLSAKDKVFFKMAKKVTVPGFRKGGTVPEKVARKYVNPMDIQQEAINYLLPVGYKYVLSNETNIEVIMQPEGRIDKVDDNELVITYVVTVRPEVKLGQYRDLEVKRGNFLVGDDEVSAELEKIRKNNAELVVTEESAKLGDTANIDFEGFIDDVAFEGGKGLNYDLELGAGKFIPGFEEQIVGLKAGENKDINVTFPENYHKEFAGKNAIFKIKVNEVKVLNLPELNDELALLESIEGVNNLADLRNNLYDSLAKQKEENAEKKVYNELVEKICAASDLTIPSKILQNDIEESLENFKKRLEEQGTDYENYKKMTGQDDEAVKKELEKNCINQIKVAFVLGQIARENNIKVSNDDLNLEYTKLAEQFNMPVEQVKEALKEREEELSNQIFNRKIQEFLKSINNIN